jgi:hypothetical protein
MNSQTVCPTYHKLFETSFKKLIIYPKASRMFNRRERIFDHKLNIDVDPNLMESNSHGGSLRVSEHHKLGVARRFVVVQLVLGGTVR